MKLLRLLGFALFAFSVTARGDLTIVQTMEGSEGSNKITFKVKGDKARIEMGPRATTIVDVKSGDLTTLLNDKKAVMRVSGERAKAMAELAKAFVKDEVPEQPVPKPTGRKETILGYETEEYVSDSPKFHAIYWVAKTYPNYQQILQQMSLLKQGAFASITKSLPDYRALPGLPLRTKVNIPGQGEVTSTIESVSLAPVSPSEFAVPPGYSEMQMPDFLGGKKAPDKSSTP
ncbi:MAG: DUF4412 domain-containing protein [Chthoniobacterales bacterium]